MKALYRPQKKAISLICSLIESPNLSKVQKVLKKDSRFKAFTVKCI